MVRVLRASLAFVIACGSGSQPPAASTTGQSPCAAFCEHLAACSPLARFEGAAACTRQCEADPRQQAGPCREPRIAYERCMLDVACDDIRRTRDADPKAGPCATEVAAILACEPTTSPQPIEFQF
jgi:hypothetical protein